VIEEDGKTEEKFVEELLAMNQDLSGLSREARKLENLPSRVYSRISLNFFSISPIPRGNFWWMPGSQKDRRQQIISRV
jgi:hypothetical protein